MIKERLHKFDQAYGRDIGILAPIILVGACLIRFLVRGCK